MSKYIQVGKWFRSIGPSIISPNPINLIIGSSKLFKIGPSSGCTRALILTNYRHGHERTKTILAKRLPNFIFFKNKMLTHKQQHKGEERRDSEGGDTVEDAVFRPVQRSTVVLAAAYWTESSVLKKYIIYIIPPKKS